MFGTTSYPSCWKWCSVSQSASYPSASAAEAYAKQSSYCLTKSAWP